MKNNNLTIIKKMITIYGENNTYEVDKLQVL